MAWLPVKTGHLTGLSGRGSGTVPVPASAEAHASSSGMAPRAAAAPALRPRKDLRVSLRGAPWPCQPSRGCAIASASCYRLGEDAEVVDQAVHVGLVVLDRDQPLLDLAPGREEDAAVVLIKPVRVAVPVVNAQETAVAGDRFGGEHHAALGAGGDHVSGQTRGGDGLLDAGLGPEAEFFDVLVGLGSRHLGEHGAGGGHGQRVTVERTHHLVAAVGHVVHDGLRAADRGHRDTAAQGLGQRDEVGLDVFLSCDTPGADGEAGLHLVEGEQGVVLVEEGFQAGEVAGLGLDDAGVHHDRLDDHARDLALVGFQEPGHAVQVVKRGDQGQIGDGLGDAGGRRRAVRLGGWTRLFGFWGDGDLDRVVVAVVAPLDLDDQVAAGDGAHQVDGVHGRLGARVGEPPARQTEAAGEFAGYRDGVRGRLGKMGTAADLGRYGFLDGRVAVAGQGGAVAAVQVHVLVAVDVVDLRAVAVAEPDRLRRGDLPAGGDAAGQVLPGGFGRVRGRCARPGAWCWAGWYWAGWAVRRGGGRSPWLRGLPGLTERSV